MNQPSQSSALPEKNNSKTPAIADEILGYVSKAIDQADEVAAIERVEKMRKAEPDLSADDLAEQLIKSKCWQTGAVGAITSGAATIPGLGTLTALTFGVAADIGLTFKMNAELVLEIANAYQRSLAEAEKRNAILLVTGISAGVNQLLPKAGQKIAENVTQQLAQKSISKTIPVIGVATSASTNALTTYIIGQRAQAYFSLGPEAVGDWGENLRAISGLDERKLIAWLGETTERSWEMVSNTTENVTTAIVEAGKSAGEVVIIGGGKVTGKIGQAGKTVVDKTGRSAAKLGNEIVQTGSNVGGAVKNTGTTAGQAIAGAGKAIFGTIGRIPGKIKQGIVSGSKKVASIFSKKRE